MNRRHSGVIAGAGLAVLLCAPSHTLAQTSPSLGTAGSYSVLAGSQVTNTGATTISGDVGISPGIGPIPHFTGFGTVTLGGSVHDADVAAANAQGAKNTAYGALDQGCTVTFPGAFHELAGTTLVPGVYCATSFHLTGGTLTLSGTASDVWIFKSSSDLIIAGGAPTRVVSPSCDVWWRVVSSATFDAGSSLIGNILADTSITLAAGATLSGRALARTAEVTLSSNTISTCVPPAVPPALPPSLAKGFLAASIVPGGVSTLTVTLSNPNTSVATLTAALTDTLPAGVVVAPTPNASTTCSGTGAVVATAGGSTVTLPVTRSIPAGVGFTPGTCTMSVDVTAAAAGVYVNTLAVGALQTSNGNNAAAATATLTVPAAVGPPTLAKGFSPISIGAFGTSTLTITLLNPNATVATLTAAFTDTLPSGLLIAGAPNASTTCSGSGAVVAVAAGTTVTLPATRSIPAGSVSAPGSCTVTVNVTGSIAGAYINTLPANVLQTSNGANAAPVSATLTIVPTVPTLAGWAMIGLTLLLGMAGYLSLRRQARQS